jgi:hypothetical protein
MHDSANVPAPSTITAILSRSGALKELPKMHAHNWLLAMLHAEANFDGLPGTIIGHPDLPILLQRLKSGRLGIVGAQSRFWQIGKVYRPVPFVAL